MARMDGKQGMTDQGVTAGHLVSMYRERLTEVTEELLVLRAVLELRDAEVVRLTEIVNAVSESEVDTA